jgi:hypothetical protein
MSKPYEIRVEFGTSQPASEPPEEQPAEFKRFEELTGRLLTVPKSELDEEREKS